MLDTTEKLGTVLVASEREHLNETRTRLDSMSDEDLWKIHERYRASEREKLAAMTTTKRFFYNLGKIYGLVGPTPFDMVDNPESYIATHILCHRQWQRERIAKGYSIN